MGATELLVKLTAETAEFKREMAAAHASTKSLQKGFGDVGSRLTKMGEEVKSAVLAYASFEGVKILIEGIVEETMQAEQATARLNAVLSATGHAAGLTAANIDDLATAMERNTLFDAEDVKNAAAALATFDNVSGQTFRTAIQLSGDLASVLGGDLQSNAVKLGKMLEQPLANIDALSKAGVKFTDLEKEHIKTLLEHNRLAEAQAEVLKKVTDRVGGTAQAIIGSGGLTPAANSLHDAWKELLETMGKTPDAGSDAMTFAGGLKATLEGTADEIRFIKGFFDSLDPHSMKGLTKELEKQQALLKANANTGFGGVQMTDAERERNRKAIQGRIDLIQQEMHALDQADEHAAAREHIGAGAAPVVDTPEAIAARKAAAERRKKEAEEAQKLITQSWRDRIAEDKAGAAAEASIEKWLSDQYEASTKHDADVAQKAHEERQKQLDFENSLAQDRYNEEVKQAAQVQEVWTHALKNISDDFAQAFDDVFEGRLRTLRDFAQEAIRIVQHMFAEMAAAKLAGGLSSGIFSALFGAKLPGLGDLPTVNINTPSPLGASPAPSVGGPRASAATPVNVSVSINAIDSRSFTQSIHQHAAQITAAVVAGVNRNPAAAGRLARGAE